MEWRYHGEAKAREVESNLHRLPIAVIAVDVERATRAAALKQKHNLGYADAFAAELADESGALGSSPPIRNFPSWERRCQCTRFLATKNEGEGVASG